MRARERTNSIQSFSSTNRRSDSHGRKNTTARTRCEAVSLGSKFIVDNEILYDISVNYARKAGLAGKYPTKLDAQQLEQRRRRFMADAVAVLHQAVADGIKDAARLKNEPLFDPIRSDTGIPGDPGRPGFPRRSVRTLRDENEWGRFTATQGSATGFRSAQALTRRPRSSVPTTFTTIGPLRAGCGSVESAGIRSRRSPGPPKSRRRRRHPACRAPRSEAVGLGTRTRDQWLPGQSRDPDGNPALFRDLGLDAQAAVGPDARTQR